MDLVHPAEHEHHDRDRQILQEDVRRVAVPVHVPHCECGRAEGDGKRPDRPERELPSVVRPELRADQGIVHQDRRGHEDKADDGVNPRDRVNALEIQIDAEQDETDSPHRDPETILDRPRAKVRDRRDPEERGSQDEPGEV